ncbi:MAG: LPS export ABC transporter ATP-binding protein [Neisseriaceae bacterium]|nr:LPS export ABC transporter ATP-binding protein [Neisseriaceae bacterium]MBO7554343.1 LPS export ABC transporter ATP-binding protein [Neisseriaceae bacterium]MBP5790235.1 LPS export ABC transporter ATP-binding protein [Neisseriaceae bacterium]MBQ5429988.1 LPS export ABC transporter ATP-binding protein [Neisseriaceae bacterium]
MAEKETLSAQHLRKHFGKREVVKDVSLELTTGEVLGLLGPNGAGKTTCFYMIVGLIAADSGTITINQHDITRQPIHQRAKMGVGYLPQEASIFRGMNVADNIRAILQLYTNDKNEVEKGLQSLLSELRIEHIADSPAVALSGGERRRVEIARTLAMKPKFILLDEPFAGVDPIAVIDIQKIIMFLKERGIGVLITDHNVRETLRICDRACIISDGTVLASGLPKDLVENEEVRKAYLGENFNLT